MSGGGRSQRRTREGSWEGVKQRDQAMCNACVNHPRPPLLPRPWQELAGAADLPSGRLSVLRRVVGLLPAVAAGR